MPLFEGGKENQSLKPIFATHVDTLHIKNN